MKMVPDIHLKPYKWHEISILKNAKQRTWGLPFAPSVLCPSRTEQGFSTLLAEPRSEWSTLMGFLIFNLINFVKIKAYQEESAQRN